MEHIREKTEMMMSLLSDDSNDLPPSESWGNICNKIVVLLSHYIPVLQKYTQTDDDKKKQKS